jgi:hypothetical protein
MNQTQRDEWTYGIGLAFITPDGSPLTPAQVAFNAALADLETAADADDAAGANVHAAYARRAVTHAAWTAAVDAVLNARDDVPPDDR